MCQRCAVVLEELIPEPNLPLIVVEQRAASHHQEMEQPCAAGIFMAARHGYKAVKAVQIAQIDISLPEHFLAAQVR